MASAYSVTTYRDPEKLDISVLGKAMQYKQQNYDQNVTEVQQLVNQYAGVDLLKDVDKEYFSQRLGTIVKYVNESGTRDWGRKNVSSQIQNYVSGALDENVINAIGSAKTYRNQMAKIEEIKKSKPENWSLQNQEFATQDLQRYLGSTQVGEKYQARDYVNYKDVQKTILDNAKLLKEYGVEYKFEPIGGNAYFTRIGKKERIEPEVAKEFLNMMMTPDMKNQLSIDGWYTFRGAKDEDLQSRYTSKLDATLGYNEKRKGELTLALASAVPSKKAEIQQNIDLLNKQISNIGDQKQQKLGRQGLIDNLYSDDFYNKNISFLSYDRIVDSFVDDSGFKFAQFDHNVKMDQWNAQQKVNEFNYKTQQDAVQNSFESEKLQIQAKSAGLVKNSDGSYSADPSSTSNGIITTDGATTLDKIEAPDGFLQAEAAHNAGATQFNVDVVKEVEQILGNKANSKLAEGLKKNSPKALAWQMVNSPGQSEVLYNLLSTNGKNLVDKVRGTTAALRTVDAESNSMRDDALKMVYALESPNTKTSSKKLIDIANNGYTLDTKGNLVQGSSMSDRKDNFAQAARVIGVYNSMLSGGGLSQAKEAQIRRLIFKELRTIKDENGKEIDPAKAAGLFEKLTYSENVKGGTDRLLKLGATMPIVGDIAELVAKGAQGLANAVTDSNDYAFGDDFANYRQNAESGRYNKRGIMNDKYSYNGIGTRNEDINSLGESDIDVKRLGFTPDQMRERWNIKMDATSAKLANFSYDMNKTLNVSLAGKAGQAMLPGIQAMLPVGTNIEKDSNIQMVVDQKTGLATITASIKDGKEYAPVTFQGISMASLPSQILNTIKIEDDNKTYSASNPHAVPYKKSIELENNQDDYMRKIDYMPEKDRYNAMQNPPLTKEDVISRFRTTYGEELVNKNIKEISSIINTPVDISTEAINGKWSVVARQNGTPIYMSDGRDEIYNRDLMSQQSELLVTQLITEKITKVLNRK